MALPEKSGAPPVAEHLAEDGRFGFGENWRRFSAHLDEARIAEAERSLREMLGVDSLRETSFLDIGCGSGLFSLAAARLGAERIHSFDFDTDSVACTAELRKRSELADSTWSVEHGSVLDEGYMRSLGTFDVVYSWGVLHHTGNLERALEYAAIPVAQHGRLFISIYNDQGRASRRWRLVKRIYNRLPRALRGPYVVLVMAPLELRSMLGAVLRLRPLQYVRSNIEYKRTRGMSRWHDLVDWVGGYPFEVATPDAVFDFYRQRGFTLERLVTCRDWGCNEYVFRR